MGRKDINTPKTNKFEYKVWGDRALFSTPESKIGGEKFTYNIPTYEALKGITESIYWKPTITYYIDAVRILNPIKTEKMGVRLIKHSSATKKSDRAIYVYLTDVAYEVKGHIGWNTARPDLEDDRNIQKHMELLNRNIKKGGRCDVFLGTRECQAYVKPCNFGEDAGYYDGIDMDFGLMYHGMNYSPTGKIIDKRLWFPRMKDGIIEFAKPNDCDAYSRVIRD